MCFVVLYTSRGFPRADNDRVISRAIICNLAMNELVSEGMGGYERNTTGQAGRVPPTI